MKKFPARRALLPVLTLLLLWMHPGTTWAAAPGFLLEIDGPIGPAISAHVVKSLQVAADRDAQLVVLRIDTPGGLDASMRDIVKAILASPVPVIGYVGPSGARAASAGTYILYATHHAAMAPATNLGAATPVAIGGPPKMPEMPSGKQEGKDDDADREAAPAPGNAAERKAVNDAVAYIRGLAERRGRNADWAEQAVRNGASISAAEALEQNVIETLAEDITTLLKELDGRQFSISGAKVTLQTDGLTLITLEPDWRTELLAILTNPTVAYLLLMIGIYGLILEGYSPGALVPGVVGAICLLLALFALQLLPVNYTGLALIILGVVLMIAEGFMPSFGILGFGGVAAFVIGSIMLLDTEVPGYQVPLALVAGIASAAVLLIAMTMYLLLRSRRRALVTGRETLVGAAVEAIEDFSGEGPVWLHGERWTAECARPVRKGQKLTITARDGLRLTVEPAAETETTEDS